MSETAIKSLTAAETRVILAEVLRRALWDILEEQAAPLRPTNAEIETRIQELESEIKALRRNARRNDAF
ncbi:hypothetical protein [Rubellimicrobium roseum]|uniref:Accessory factor UbiK family protein n=1 Tax=Rubellimicrobium roseum TaxID=687525 RepID=A0A5C4N7B2_9RHOB|nr:hypothetical protein [Rubellimicrobium roseum]TNC63736.1 hypothetical protein FHG71_19075 [Rubellimicrobium roseum]